MPTTDLVIPQVHPALLLLPQSVVVLVGVRVERSRNTIAFCASVQVGDFRAFGRHGPPAHVQQCLAFGCCHQERVVVRTMTTSAAEVDIAQLTVKSIERHGFRQLIIRQILRRDANHHTGRSEGVAFRIALVRPSLRGRLANKPISWIACPRSRVGAYRHSHNVRSIGNQRNHAPIPLQHQ
jgi:hypothetical protein